MSDLTFLKIGKRLKKARKNCGYTQSDVAKMTELNRVTISKIENGNKNIDSLTLKKLAKVYGYSLTYFLEEEEEHEELSISFRTDKLTETELEAVKWVKKLLFNFEDLKEIKEGDI
ncbi:MAG: helix-turn-helix domain-containing protein [Halanaerobiales bacterium]|nr:helix-turn-helix domain-containing protein [Halanaerobiales bacterium]